MRCYAPLLDPQEGAQRDELLYLQVEVLPAQFPLAHIGFQGRNWS
jgi:hypothetical protein